MQHFEAEKRPLTIRLFGGMEVWVEGCPLPKLRSQRELWLLALLVLQRGRSVTRLWLAQTLWPFPDHSVDLAAYNIRRALTNLRKALGTQAARIEVPQAGSLRFDIDGVACDLFAFDSACATETEDPASLEGAIRLYTGPLLQECTEPWAIAERERCEQRFLQALKVLSADARLRGDHEAVIHYRRHAANIDPLKESAQYALMEALAQQGNIVAAMQTYQEFSLRLHRDQSARPGPDITALYQKLRAQVRNSTLHRDDETQFVTTTSPRLRRLPIPLTTLIGREEESDEIRKRFQQLRLLTLTGAGGVGKTRLAIHLAERLAPEFHDGVCFVDMVALADETQVVQMTISALEVPEVPAEQRLPLLDTLTHFLRSKQLLLVLDNCEHLIDACARLAETSLQSCRDLRILTTSRQSLGIRGEAIWRVASLSLPPTVPSYTDTETETDVKALERYTAIQLFVERANQIEPAFRLTPENALAVARICTQLDGIPLALELAAARVGALPVQRIEERLSDRFRLLTTGARTALSRQQTLEAAIRWSFDLLLETDRIMLCALAVFQGGWTLEAAEAITSGLGEVSDALTRLVDRSLVVYENEGNRARYRLLETVRQYCREKLYGEHPTVVRTATERHLDYYLALAEQSRTALQGTDQADWLDILEKEHDNLRVALEGSREKTKEERTEERTGTMPEKSLRMASALWRFWHRRGYVSLGRRYLERTLEQTADLGATSVRAEGYNSAGMLALLQGDLATAKSDFETCLAIAATLDSSLLRADALHCLGRLGWNQRNYALASSYFQAALAIQRELDNRSGVAHNLSYLGVVSSDAGDFASARDHLEESLAIARQLGDRPLIASALHSLAHMAFYQDDYEQARSYYGEELRLARSLQDRDLIATALHRMGSVEHTVHNYAIARQLFEESLTIARQLGYRDLVSAIVFRLGHTARALNDLPAAHSCYAERLAICRESDDYLGISYAIDAFAGLYVLEQQPERAVLLYAAAQRLREDLERSVVNGMEAPHLQRAQDILGDVALARLWEEGRSLSAEDAIYTCTFRSGPTV